MENGAVTPWVIATVGGPMILGAALIYGIALRRRRATSPSRRSADYNTNDPNDRRGETSSRR